MSVFSYEAMTAANLVGKDREFSKAYYGPLGQICTASLKDGELMDADAAFKKAFIERCGSDVTVPEGSLACVKTGLESGWAFSSSVSRSDINWEAAAKNILWGVQNLFLVSEEHMHVHSGLAICQLNMTIKAEEYNSWKGSGFADRSLHPQMNYHGPVETRNEFVHDLIGELSFLITLDSNEFPPLDGNRAATFVKCLEGPIGTQFIKQWKENGDFLLKLFKGSLLNDFTGLYKMNELYPFFPKEFELPLSPANKAKYTSLPVAHVHSLWSKYNNKTKSAKLGVVLSYQWKGIQYWKGCTGPNTATYGHHFWIMQLYRKEFTIYDKSQLWNMDEGRQGAIGTEEGQLADTKNAWKQLRDMQQRGYGRLLRHPNVTNNGRLWDLFTEDDIICKFETLEENISRHTNDEKRLEYCHDIDKFIKSTFDCMRKWYGDPKQLKENNRGPDGKPMVKGKDENYIGFPAKVKVPRQGEVWADDLPVFKIFGGRSEYFFRFVETKHIGNGGNQLSHGSLLRWNDLDLGGSYDFEKDKLTGDKMRKCFKHMKLDKHRETFVSTPYQNDKMLKWRDNISEEKKPAAKKNRKQVVVDVDAHDNLYLSESDSESEVSETE